jgi:hypothetical protein
VAVAAGPVIAGEGVPVGWPIAAPYSVAPGAACGCGALARDWRPLSAHPALRLLPARPSATASADQVDSDL